MARIVPAKPKATAQLAHDLLVELEGLLPDSYIIFQGLAGSDGMLIMAPERRALAILILEGADSIDLDARELTGPEWEVDLDQVVQALGADLQGHGLGHTDVVIVLPNGNLPNGGMDLGSALGEGRVRVVAGQGAATDALQMATGMETPSSINQVMQSVHPGSSEYIPGTVTEAQERWRNSVGSQRPPMGDGPVLRGEAPASGDSSPLVSAPAITRPVSLPHRSARLTFNAKSGKRVAYLKAMLTACVRNIAGGRPIFSSGVEVDPGFVAGPDLLLPAVLVAAAESWTPVVVKAGGIGGFDIRLSRDPQALIGFKVSDVLTSSPTTLFMPVAHLIHSTLTEDGEFMLDEIVSTYYRWAQKYDLENADLESIDFKIALKAIDSDGQ